MWPPIEIRAKTDGDENDAFLCQYLGKLSPHDDLISIRQRRVQRFIRLAEKRPSSRFSGLLTQSQRAAISVHVLVVLGEAAGEAVVAVAIADEVEEFCAVRMQGRFESAFARIRDWTRRQPREA